jgi:hypothetical protein
MLPSLKPSVDSVANDVQVGRLEVEFSGVAVMHVQILAEFQGHALIERVFPYVLPVVFERLGYGYMNAHVPVDARLEDRVSFGVDAHGHASGDDALGFRETPHFEREQRAVRGVDAGGHAPILNRARACQ